MYGEVYYYFYYFFMPIIIIIIINVLIKVTLSCIKHYRGTVQ